MFIATFQALMLLLVAWILGYVPLGGTGGSLLACVYLVLLTITAVGLGLIVAARAKDIGATSGLTMILFVPMMIFGTYVAVFNEMTRNIARLMPSFSVSDSL
jgi:ABC-type multidrug transport system permease subunit